MAIVDARTLPDGQVVDRDVVVIGSGPAGLAVASELAGKRLSVAVLESGGLEPDDDTQSLAAGEVAGRPYPDLDVARLRYFGGTSNHWGGNVHPLDPLDFAARRSLRHSGWPIGHADLAPYYARAARFCGLPENAFGLGAWTGPDDAAPLRFAEQAVTTRVFHTVGPDQRRFGTVYLGRMKSAPNVDVLLFANVTEIVTDDAAKRVTGLTVRTLTGKRLVARGRHYVLAAGGIENARLLLLSDRVAREGVGNAHDLVGRFFMDHLTLPDFGRLLPSDPFIRLGLYRGHEAPWGDTWGALQLNDRIRSHDGLTNIRYQFATEVNAFNENMETPALRSAGRLRESLAGAGPADSDFHRHVANVVADIDSLGRAAYYWLRYRPNYPLRWVELVQIGEQLPNPASRVRLGDRRDRLGQRQVVLDWRLTPADSDAVRRSADRLARQFGRSALGRLNLRIPEGVFRDAHPKPHFHHMGTTRMHADPRRGVVDAQCRVHGVGNLYVAGSSVFPTVGNANPTLTIIALALRLADRLHGNMRA